jgi:hypothetical protein
MLGAAALLDLCDMRYVDKNDAIEIYRGKYEFPSVVFPKDGHSDSLRFQDALQCKIFESCGGLPLAGVLPVPLSTTKKVMQPAEWLDFYGNWEKKEIKSTVAIWKHCFETMAWEHKKKGVFVELDLQCEHYYNVIVFEDEEGAFEAANPRFVRRKCRDQACHDRVDGVKSGGDHAHYVHGAYAGGKIGDVSYAPPMRLASFWENAVSFQLIHLVEALIETNAQRASLVRGNPANVNQKLPWSFGCGAVALANLVKRGDDVGLQELFELFRNPRTAAWTSIKAYDGKDERALHCFEAQKRSLLQSVKRRGVRHTLTRILQHLWNCDRTKGKVLAMSVLEEYSKSDQARMNHHEDRVPPV